MAQKLGSNRDDGERDAATHQRMPRTSNPRRDNNEWDASATHGMSIDFSMIDVQLSPHCAFPKRKEWA